MASKRWLFDGMVAWNQLYHFPPYDPCPCGSGKILRNCCLSKSLFPQNEKLNSDDLAILAFEVLHASPFIRSVNA